MAEQPPEGRSRSLGGGRRYLGEACRRSLTSKSVAHELERFTDGWGQLRLG